MSPLRVRLSALGRAAALAATAAALLATSTTPCRSEESASYAVETSCGPAGEVTLSYSSEDDGGCGGCYAYLEAPGAHATGLPEQGEIATGEHRGSLDDGDFALVGPAPVAGAVPPRLVERTCRFTPASPGVLEVACTGTAADAACGGTLTRLAAQDAP